MISPEISLTFFNQIYLRIKLHYELGGSKLNDDDCAHSLLLLTCYITTPLIHHCNSLPLE
jgi:hypothetical protein